MRFVPPIAGLLLGLTFVAVSVMVLFNLVSGPPPVPGSHAEAFMGVFAATGYLTFVKIFELLGGILVAIPRTRNFGLLILGPIIVNIIAYHTLVMSWTDLLNPMMIIICLLALYLLWVERRAFANLLTRNNQPI